MRRLLDCEPLCGRPWRLGLATDAAERDAALRLRHDVFVTECGHPTDADAFDATADHLLVWDAAANRPVATGRAVRGDLYGGDQYDFRPLEPLRGRILQGSRTCVAAAERTGPAVQYLNYGFELLRREHGCDYLLGAESIPDPASVPLVHAYLSRFAADPEFRVEPWPACRVDLPDVAAAADDERRLPGLVRADLRMGFTCIGPPARDPVFGGHDVLMLGRFDRLTRWYHAFVARAERR